MSAEATSGQTRPHATRRRSRARETKPVVPGRPFTRADYEASALTAWELRRTQRLVFRGVYVSADTEMTPELLAEAAILATGPNCYISHHTAARLMGGVVPDHPDVHVTYAGVRAQSEGISAHRKKRGQRVRPFKGMLMTTAEQTFLDMAHVLGLVDLVVLGDSLLKAKRTTVEAILSAAGAATGPYSRLARRAAALVRKGVDSPMETRLRLLIVLAGLPEPKVNHRVYAADGTLLRRYVLSYLRWRLVLEYDGRQHAESPEQWFSDIARDEALDEDGVRKLVFVSKDIYRTPGHTLRRITGAMRGQGMPVPRSSNEWRRYFPSRPGDVAAPA